ncbi:MAG: hypothetical protein K0S42_2356 [Microvirga sp.]|nr:hypothetical protein [Microvirga sp.]
MLRHGNCAALLVGGDAGGVGVEDGQHRVPREDFTPAANCQGFALDRVVPAAIPAAPPVASTSAWKGREGDAGQAHDEAGTTRIGAVCKGAAQLVESDVPYEIGIRPKTLGLQDAHIHGKGREGLRKALRLSGPDKASAGKACSGEAGTGEGFQKGAAGERGHHRISHC